MLGSVLLFSQPFEVCTASQTRPTPVTVSMSPVGQPVPSGTPTWARPIRWEQSVVSAAASNAASLTTSVSAHDTWSRAGCPSQSWGIRSPATDRSACRHGNGGRPADVPHRHPSARAGAWAPALFSVCLSPLATSGLSGPAVSAVLGARCEPLQAPDVQAGMWAGTAACQSTAARPAQLVLWYADAAWGQGMLEAGLTCATKVTLCMPVSSSSSLLAAIKGFSGGAIPPCSHSCHLHAGRTSCSAPCLWQGW